MVHEFGNLEIFRIRVDPMLTFDSFMFRQFFDVDPEQPYDHHLKRISLSLTNDTESRMNVR